MSAVAAKKSKFDKTPAGQKERSESPQGYYPDGSWAGFFYSEEFAIDWCKKEKGRYYNFVPLPKIERVLSVVKRSIKVPAKGRGSASSGNGSIKRGSKRSVAPSQPRTVDWNAEDIGDEKKLAEVAEKSKEAAIKKLKGKK